VLFFHFITEGCCKVRLADSTETIDVAAGDLVLFLNEDKHVMGSDLQLAPVEAASLIGPDTANDLIQMRHGGCGAATRFVCGYLACSRSVCRLVFEALPRVLRIPIGEGPASTLLRESLRAGVLESSMSRPGARSMLAKLSELMFVDALRRHIENMPAGGRGWLAGVRDPHIGRALALLHAKPDKLWTVEELAREVALSRSALADRFVALVGETPMQHLTRWRLALAAQTLRSGREPIARVAERSGYEAEAAFSRAFRREFGMSPAAWRKSGPQGRSLREAQQGT
jgi:AraC-like DNA-binding protein